MTLQRGRSNLYSAPGRIVQTQRIDARYGRVVVQMYPQTAALYWDGIENDSTASTRTYIRIIGAGAKMQWWLNGLLLAEVDAFGDWFLRDGLEIIANPVTSYDANNGTPTNSALRWSPSSQRFQIYRNVAGPGGGTERVASLRQDHGIQIHKSAETGELRDISFGNALGTYATDGVIDADDMLRVVIGGQVVLQIDASTAKFKGSVVEGAL